MSCVLKSFIFFPNGKSFPEFYFPWIAIWCGKNHNFITDERVFFLVKSWKWNSDKNKSSKEKYENILCKLGTKAYFFWCQSFFFIFHLIMTLFYGSSCGWSYLRFHKMIFRFSFFLLTIAKGFFKRTLVAIIHWSFWWLNLALHQRKTKKKRDFKVTHLSVNKNIPYQTFISVDRFFCSFIGHLIMLQSIQLNILTRMWLPRSKLLVYLWYHISCYSNYRLAIKLRATFLFFCMENNYSHGGQLLSRIV